MKRVLFNRVLSAGVLLAAAGVALPDETSPAPAFADALLSRSTWRGVKQFGGAETERGYFSAADRHGNLYVTGYTASDLDGPGPGVNAGGLDIYVMKLNPKGHIEWIRQFGSPGEDSAFAIALDYKGYIYITGQIGGDLDPNDGEIFRGHGEEDGDDHARDGDDAFLMKLDPDGKVQWLRQFGTTDDDAGFGLDLDLFGNPYVVGYTWSDIDGDGPDTHAGQADVFLAAFDANGKRRWIRQIGSPEDDVAYAVAVDRWRGDIYATGFSIGSLDDRAGPHVNAGGQDIVAIKFNRQGKLKWVRQFGTPGDDNGYAIAVDYQRQVYISGFVSGDLDGAGPDVYAGDADLAVLKIGRKGDLIWSRQLGTGGNDFGLGVAVNLVGAVYATGAVFGDLDGAGPQTYQGARDVAAIKFAPNGATRWIRQWGTARNDWGFHIALESRCQVRVTGQTGGDLDGPGPETYAGGFDIFVLKFAEPQPCYGF